MATASITNPVYTTNLIKANGTKYRLKDVTTDMVVSSPKNQLAGKVTLSLVNVKVGTSYLHSLIALKDKVYVYANTGEGAKEVFRGFVWERKVTRNADGYNLHLVCYDRLAYFHNCKDNLFVKKGKKTKDVLTSLAKKWGFKISFNYESISHKKLVYHNESIADIFISILDAVKKKTGKKYAVRMEKDVIIIETVGLNKAIYQVHNKANALASEYRQTMDGLVTKVQIVKAETVKKKETGKYLTVTNVKKNTDKYGTLQEIMVKGRDDKLSEVKKEAKELLKEKATPKTEFDVTAVDIPWVQKGHKVHIQSGNLNNYYIVEGIEHDVKEHVMQLEVSKA